MNFMKRKILSLLTLTFILSISLFVFTACGGGEAHEHAYSETIVGATCVEQGYTLHKCSCGDSYEDTFVSKIPHTLNADGECSTCTATASAGLKINLVSGSQSVRGLGTYTGKEVIIPSSVNGALVTDINTTAFKNKDIEAVYIPYTVKNIGKQAFYGCTSLTGINIPGSVTNISYSAFENCTSLTNITLPNSVTSIGPRAFSGCTSLASIHIPNGVTTIGFSAFHECTSLTSIDIPDSVISIGEWAFYGCSFTSITIPNRVTTICDLTFGSCTSLTSITIPSSVTSIGSGAFDSCSALTELRYGGTVAEWNKVTLGSSWKYNVPAKKIICANGEVAI